MKNEFGGRSSILCPLIASGQICSTCALVSFRLVSFIAEMFHSFSLSAGRVAHERRRFEITENAYSKMAKKKLNFKLAEAEAEAASEIIEITCRTNFVGYSRE